MTQRYPCPVKGCGYNARKEDGIFRHLYEEHRKATIVQTIIEILWPSKRDILALAKEG